MVILVDEEHLPDDIYKIICATEQQEIVAKLLIKYMMDNNGEIGKTEMGVFAQKLHDGQVTRRIPVGTSPLLKEAKISYNKRQFYDRILTPLRGMGLIEYDLYRKKYLLSDRFNKLMVRIGLLWLRELERGKKR